MMELLEGQRVKLKANEEEGWPEEYGEIEVVTRMPWGYSVIVRLDDKYRSDKYDDGIREVTMEQIEKV